MLRFSESRILAFAESFGTLLLEDSCKPAKQLELMIRDDKNWTCATKLAGNKLTWAPTLPDGACQMGAELRAKVRAKVRAKGELRATGRRRMRVTNGKETRRGGKQCKRSARRAPNKASRALPKI